MAPRQPTQTELFLQLLEIHEGKINEAFLESVADISDSADFGALEAALKAGNVQAAIEALHLEAAAYAPLAEALREAFTAGGAAGVAAMPRRYPDGAALVFRFDVRNPIAEAWLRQHSSQLITRIVDDQRQAVRAALVEGMASGDNPRKVALSIVGPTSRISGRREGGLVGLTEAQGQYALNAERELASEDPADLKSYLNRERRDRRYDPEVRKAIADGSKVPSDIQARALLRYKSRLLGLRGEMIARTEAMTSLQAGKYNTFQQAVSIGKVPMGSVRRTWKSAGDNRVRHTHIGLDEKSVGLDEPFQSPSGALLLFPGDTSYGAPAEEVIGCRCDVNYRIDFLANVR